MYLGINERGTISIQGNERGLVKKITIDENTANMLMGRGEGKREDNKKRMEEFLFHNLEGHDIQGEEYSK